MLVCYDCASICYNKPDGDETMFTNILFSRILAKTFWMFILNIHFPVNFYGKE